jgi:putative transposase
MSERRACRLVNQPRGTQRYQLTRREDEDALTQAIVEFAVSMDVTATAGSRRC